MMAGQKHEIGSDGKWRIERVKEREHEKRERMEEEQRSPGPATKYGRGILQQLVSAVHR